MTVVAVLADPPRPGLVLSELAETSPLSPAEAADLYAAMLKDAVVAVDRSGGDLLVNYRAEGGLPPEHRAEGTDTPDPEAAVRALVADALGGTGGVRFEVQVGSTASARAGNTVTHLLREEGADSVAVVRPNTPFLTRTAIDSAAMKLRSAAVVLGPGTHGSVHYAGFVEPVDFEGALGGEELSTLARRGVDASLDVDFLPVQPVLDHGRDLLSVLPLLEAYASAQRTVPVHTASLLQELGLRVAGDGETRRIVRE